MQQPTRMQMGQHNKIEFDLQLILVIYCILFPLNHHGLVKVVALMIP
jgi:hypothetical protein